MFNRYSIISKNIMNKDEAFNNRMAFFNSPNKNSTSINSPQNINSYIENEKNFSRNNYHGKTISIYNKNLIMNKNFLENLKKTKNNYNSNLNNRINDNILSELKNDNILNMKKSNIVNSSKRHSLHYDINKEYINNNYNNDNNIHIEPNLNRFSIISKKRNIKTYKSEDEDDEYLNYIKVITHKKNKLKQRRSFNKADNDNLKKFQKLLKIDLKDVDAKLNNFNNTSSSFEFLNENQEIYDRFIDTNTFIKDINQNNYNIINENNNIKINILSYPLKNNNDNIGNRKEENSIGKNKISSKTTNDLYTKESNKKKNIKNIQSLKSIKNKNIYKIIKRNDDSRSLLKKTNSNIFNLESDTKNKKNNGFFFRKIGNLSYKKTDYSNKYHHYFIGFEHESDNEKNKKKNKNKNFK